MEMQQEIERHINRFESTMKKIDEAEYIEDIEDILADNLGETIRDFGYISNDQFVDYLKDMLDDGDIFTVKNVLQDGVNIDCPYLKYDPSMGSLDTAIGYAEDETECLKEIIKEDLEHRVDLLKEKLLTPSKDLSRAEEHSHTQSQGAFKTEKVR